MATSKRKDDAERLPSLAGWFVESNTFRMLFEVCMGGFRKTGIRIGVIRGPNFSCVDGGLIFNPPKSFPMGDPSKAWAWVQEHRHNQDLEVLPIEVKMNLTARQTHQIAPIFMVVPPEHPDVVCILPIHSFTDLRAVWRMENTDGHTLVKSASNKAFRMRSRGLLYFEELLAQYAVPRRDLFLALNRLGYASKNGSIYQNPSNEVNFHGWILPKLEPNMNSLLRIRLEQQKSSAAAIQLVTKFLQERPDHNFELLFNLIQPLGCDFVLWDSDSSVTYFVEHKNNKPDSRDSLFTLEKTWIEEKLNWHFLLYQKGDQLVIHTREDLKHPGTTPPCLVNLADNAMGSVFVDNIRKHGGIAKQRLQSKWRQENLYDDSLPTNDDNSNEPAVKVEKESTRQKSYFRSVMQQLRSTFCDAINDQCYKLGRNVCIGLSGNACGDAALIEHDWTDDDLEGYEASSILPLSLVRKRGQKNPGCILLRFLSHSRPPHVTSSDLFEPARSRTIEIPTCTAQPFIYVAATGGVPIPDQPANLDKLVLLPSEFTVWLNNSNHCGACDDRNQIRQWRYVIQTMKDGQGAGQPGSSLVQAPFLNEGANPLLHIYDFKDGSVHERLNDLLSNSESPYVIPVFGPRGLLQRQWNHGTPRQIDDGVSPTQKLMHRILTTLPPNTLPAPPDDIQNTIQDEMVEIKKEKPCSDRTARDKAHKKIINDTDCGILLKELTTQFGFQTDFELRCDHCKEDECYFYRPEIAYGMPAKPVCGNCRDYGKVCTFNNIANTPELEAQLRKHALFRRHVPCNQCYRDGKECDNRTNSCERCKNRYECVREACANANEPGDNSHCHRSCDKVHIDDGYENVADIPRDKGRNARQAAQEEARKTKHS